MPETLRITEPAAAGDALAAAIDTIDRSLEHLDRAASLDAFADTLSADPRGATLALLAGLACGRPGRVRSLLRLCAAAHDRRSGEAASETALPPDVAHVLPLLAARYVAWTADLSTALAAWPAVRAVAAAATAVDPGVDGLDRVARAGTLAGLERTATDLGDAPFAARLHRPAREAAARVPQPLPPDAACLAVALDLAVPEDAGPGPAPAPLPALHVLRAVHQVVGVSPDAPRHRLWLRPRPRAGTGIAARSIRVGEDTFSVSLSEGPGQVEARVAQDAGPIPATVLLEVRLAAPPRRIAVDGVAASLVPAQTAGGWLVPVQLVVDHPRRLVLEL